MFVYLFFCYVFFGGVCVVFSLWAFSRNQVTDADKTVKKVRR